MVRDLPIERDQLGVTLIELMVGVVVAALVVGAGLAMLTMSDKAMHASEQTVDTQQNVRIAMEFLARDLRLAGYGPVSGPVGNCPTALVPADHTVAGPDRGPDRISLIVPVGNPVGTAGNPPWVFNADTALNAGPTGAATTNVVVPAATVVTNMATEAGGSLTGPPATVSIDGTVTGTVTGAGGSILTINVVGPPIEGPMKKNTPVYLLQCITYQVVPPPDPTGLCGGRAPCLVRGVAGGMTAGVLDCTTPNSRCTPIADEIEDIQFAFACDGCVAGINSGIPDGVIDNQGGAAGFDQADFVTNNSWTTGFMTPDKIRLAQVTVVGRQRSADRGFGEANGQTNQSVVLQVSDHLHSDGVYVAGDFATLTPPYTSTRRRLLTKTVELRNLRR